MHAVCVRMEKHLLLSGACMPSAYAWVGTCCSVYKHLQVVMIRCTTAPPSPCPLGFKVFRSRLYLPNEGSLAG